MKEDKIVIIDGERYYALPEHSYASSLYAETRGDLCYNHTYIRYPVKGSTTYYADSPVTHIHLRKDVSIGIYPNGSVQVTYKCFEGSPFFNIHEYNSEKRRKKREIELFFKLLRDDGMEIDESKAVFTFEDGKIYIKRPSDTHPERCTALSGYNYVVRNRLYKKVELA